MLALKFGCAAFYVFSQCVCVAEASGKHFRGFAGDKGRSIMLKEVKSDIEVLERASVNGGKAGYRLAKIESSISRTFQALPKNAAGRLAPRAVRYIVHTYFAKEHGWVIKGLEPQGMQSNVSEVHEVNILQEMAPALVESLLETRQSSRGLSLKDVVIIAAVLERMVFDYEILLVEHAFALNGISLLEDIDEQKLHEVLKSYLYICDTGRQSVNMSDVDDHLLKKTLLTKLKYDEWFKLIEFEQHAVVDFNYVRRSGVNPFKPRRFSFDDVSEIVEMLAERYGKFQDIECRKMKEALMHMSPDGSGRVPLKDFYAYPEGMDFDFSETPDYLREVGAMDESVFGSQVLIVNYVIGPGNCVSPSGYHSVCCLSECEVLMNDIEGTVQQPTVQPVQILELVANLSSSSIDAPRKLPEDLVERLHSIADKSGGVVHLHGRLFAQWLHYAFPNDCPYPHTAAANFDAAPVGLFSDSRLMDSADRQRHVEFELQPNGKAVAENASMRKWSDDEVLPLSESENGRFSSFGAGRPVLRFAVMLGLFFGVFHVSMQAWRSMNDVDDVTYGSKRLPFHDKRAARSHYV